MRTWIGILALSLFAKTAWTRPTPVPPTAQFPDLDGARTPAADISPPDASESRPGVAQAHTAPESPVIWTEPALPYDDTVADDAEPPDERWYGGETLLVDALSLGTFALGVSSESVELGFAGALGYVAGGPILHGARGRAGTALASLGLRVGTPIVGAWLLYNASGGDDDSYRAGTNAAFGFIVGVGIAIALDAAVLAREPIKRPPQNPGADHDVTWLPTVSATKDSVSGGIVGMF